jgi:hypothetical protein
MHAQICDVRFLTSAIARVHGRSRVTGVPGDRCLVLGRRLASGHGQHRPAAPDRFPGSRNPEAPDRRPAARPSGSIALRRDRGGAPQQTALVVTLLLAGVVGLVVAALLTPVMGLLACFAVAIGLLFRKRTGNSRRKSGEHHARERGANRDRAGASAAA